MLVQLLTKSPSQSFLLSLLRAVPLTATLNPFHLPPTYPLPPLLFCYLSPPVSTLNLRPIPSAPLNNLLHPFLYPSPLSLFFFRPPLHPRFSITLLSHDPQRPATLRYPFYPQPQPKPLRLLFGIFNFMRKFFDFPLVQKHQLSHFILTIPHTPFLTTLLKLPKTEITPPTNTCSFSVILISVIPIRNITHVVQPTETPMITISAKTSAKLNEY